MSSDVREAPCPDGCEFRGQQHVHLESASTGHGQVWGIDDAGIPALLDPFDLQRDTQVRSPLRYSRTRLVLPDACYDTFFGRVHVKPGCRCAR